MADKHHGDNPEQHSKPAETQPVKTADADSARHAGTKDIKTAEAARTNASDGSLVDRRKLMAAQESSIEIVSNERVSSRTSKLTEKDLHNEQHHAEAQSKHTPHRAEANVVPAPHKAESAHSGTLPRQHQDTRTPGEKLHDFVNAAVKRAEDPESYHRYIQEEVQKFIGIGEGLNTAKEETKASAVAAWKALNDGTVARFLATPGAITDPFYKVVCTTFDAMAKDPQATNKALEHMGNELIKASNGYTAMSPREKGHVIGKTMFGMINPEGSTEAGEAALKIADNIATHVDAKVMAGVTRAYEAAQSLSKNAPKVGEHAKQMLFDYTSKLHLSPGQLQLAGIPEGYFEGMSASAGAAQKGIDKSEHMLAMSGHREVPGAPKIPEGGRAGDGHKELSEAERKIASERAREHAVRLAAQAKSSEKVITATMHDLAGHSGGEMIGLDKKFKEVDSLTRKIESGDKPEDIKDALRYTMTFSTDRFTEGTKSVLGQMKDLGYDTVKIKNTFAPEEIYKGINCAFEHPNGQVFELQFHTPESFFVKQERNHKIYDVARELVVTDETGKSVLRQANDLVAVAKKYQGKLEQYPDLDRMAGHLSSLGEREGVQDYGRNFLNALNKRMLDNYKDCEIPSNVNHIGDFKRGLTKL